MNGVRKPNNGNHVRAGVFVHAFYYEREGISHVHEDEVHPFVPQEEKCDLFAPGIVAAAFHAVNRYKARLFVNRNSLLTGVH